MLAQALRNAWGHQKLKWQEGFGFLEPSDGTQPCQFLASRIPAPRTGGDRKFSVVLSYPGSFALCYGSARILNTIPLGYALDPFPSAPRHPSLMLSKAGSIGILEYKCSILLCPPHCAYLYSALSAQFSVPTFTWSPQRSSLAFHPF